MTHHEFLCQRTRAITERRQTVLHFPGDCLDEPLGVGDTLCLIGHPKSPRGAAGVVTGVSQHRLHEILDADLPKLGDVRDTYIRSWDETNPETPYSSNPEVTRVEFRYGFSEDVLREPAAEKTILGIATKAALDDIQAAVDTEIFGKP